MLCQRDYVRSSDSRPDLRLSPSRVSAFVGRNGLVSASDLALERGLRDEERDIVLEADASDYPELLQLFPRFMSCPQLRFRAKLKYLSGSVRCLW